MFNNEFEPLIDEAEAIDGDLWLSGNRVLISLNLSSTNRVSNLNRGNQIFKSVHLVSGNLLTPRAVTSFILCIQYQATLNLLNKNVAQGLLKLNLNVSDIH